MVRLEGEQADHIGRDSGWEGQRPMAGLVPYSVNR